MRAAVAATATATTAALPLSVRLREERERDGGGRRERKEEKEEGHWPLVSVQQGQACSWELSSFSCFLGLVFKDGRVAVH